MDDKEWNRSGIGAAVSNGNSLLNLDNLMLQAKKALQEHMQNKGFGSPTDDEIKLEFEVKEDRLHLKMTCRYYIDGRYAVYEKVKA